MLIRITENSEGAHIQLFEPIDPTGPLPSARETRFSSPDIEAQVQILLQPRRSIRKRVEAATKIGSKAEPNRNLLLAIIKAFAETIPSTPQMEPLREAISEAMRHQLELAIKAHGEGQGGIGIEVVSLTSPPPRRAPQATVLHQEQITLPRSRRSPKSLARAARSAILNFLEHRHSSESPDSWLDRQAGSYQSYRETTREQLQAALDAMVGDGWSAKLPSRVRAIRDALRRASLAIRCPRCNQPAIIDFTEDQPYHPDDPGSLRFRHGTGTHGLKADNPFPELVVVDAPATRPRKKRQRSSRS